MGKVKIVLVVTALTVIGVTLAYFLLWRNASLQEHEIVKVYLHNIVISMSSPCERPGEMIVCKILLENDADKDLSQILITRVVGVTAIGTEAEGEIAQTEVKDVLQSKSLSLSLATGSSAEFLIFLPDASEDTKVSFLKIYITVGEESMQAQLAIGH